MPKNLGKAAKMTLAGLAVIGGTAAMTGSATAAPTDDISIAGCNFGQPAVPFKEGATIKTFAGSSGCDATWSFTLRLERESWRGWINEGNAPSWNGNGGGTVTYNCGGMGHMNYRGWLSVTNPVGNAWSVRSGVVRIEC
ncbi:hypothetical protein [Amycolatopsis sp. NPDC059657]|uniref:hypothetical protein n=1 Tax=Amycolatopsis sp. NPDC059657 TaxID=3346899 RepID=UPI00366DF0A0